MQAHYRVPCPPLQAIRDGLAKRPDGVEILIAERRGALLGFASACAIDPEQGLTSGFFLKERDVAAAARGRGIGRALMRALAELALARGHKRLDWTADAANPDLLGFYEGLGAIAQRERVVYRLAGEALSGLARTDA
ncbi:MAG: hypothetical protein B7Z40_16510 [Bosea sp. 12-68-7]|nr:MAG: hypothetical protein B7Z40_16510 [Bosea sp. 12-68-7]